MRIFTLFTVSSLFWLVLLAKVRWKRKYVKVRPTYRPHSGLCDFPRQKWLKKANRAFSKSSRAFCGGGGIAACIGIIRTAVTTKGLPTDVEKTHAYKHNKQWQN
jgi:hypothetical protein